MPSSEEMRKLFYESNKEQRAIKECRARSHLEGLEKQGIEIFDQSRILPERCDHPNTMEDSTATFIWIVAMIISILFKGGWLLCIIETVVWWKFITRYKK